MHALNIPSTTYSHAGIPLTPALITAALDLAALVQTNQIEELPYAAISIAILESEGWAVDLVSGNITPDPDHLDNHESDLNALLPYIY